MTTRARYYALQWFLDHEQHGPDAVFGKKPPTAKMRARMQREGQVEPVSVGQFKYSKWVLTPEGRAVLAAKPPPRRSRSMPDAKRRKAAAHDHD